MKKIMMVAVMALMTMTAFAQFRVEAGYLTAKLKADGDTSDALSSFKIGGYYMLNDIAIEKSVVEAGVAFAMGSYKEKEDGVDVKSSYSNISIPVNVGYKIEIADEFSVRPYAGINLKFNTSLKEKMESHGLSVTIDYFDVDDDEYLKANRFQFGGQVGGLVQYKQFTAGVQYQTDFTNLYKDSDEKVTMPNVAITVGMIF